MEIAIKHEKRVLIKHLKRFISAWKEVSYSYYSRKKVVER